VEVEMIARQVGEDGGGEAHAVDALQREGVRRHLHHRGLAALPDHVVEQLLHVGRLGRRAGRLALLAAQSIRDSAEQTGLEALPHHGPSGSRAAGRSKSVSAMPRRSS
jgi:hypothetical protein